MTVYIDRPSENLREQIAALRAQVDASRQQPFWFAGTGVLSAFTLPRGWKPLYVFSAGALKRDGVGNDYTVGFDGFLHTVTFAAAPSNGAAIAIIGVPA